MFLPARRLGHSTTPATLVELERIELSPSRLKVERLTIRPQFQNLVRPGWNRTNRLTSRRTGRTLPLCAAEKGRAGSSL